MHCTVYCKVSRSRPKIPCFGCTYVAVREPPCHPVSSFFFLSPSFLVSRHYEPAATAHRIFPSVPSSPSSPPHFVYFPPSRSSADARKAGKKEGKFPGDLGLRPSDHRRRRGWRCMLNIYLVGSPTLSFFPTQHPCCFRVVTIHMHILSSRESRVDLPSYLFSLFSIVLLFTLLTTAHVRKTTFVADLRVVMNVETHHSLSLLSRMHQVSSHQKDPRMHVTLYAGLTHIEGRWR